ncbi:MAG: S8 family serine peptidase, partial [Anaerolineae bacterium]
YAECFEFFLAPYPVGGNPFTEGDPSLAPHVINNSWTCPPYEGCDPDTLKAVVENVRAAGILVVAAAGNSGSPEYPDGCYTVKSPPAIYDAAFSVGATDSADVIADFSSRGFVTVDGSRRRKPDLSAPGVDIRSSVPGGSYAGNWQGTSMAAPHVAGTAALVWSSAPALIGKVDATERILGLSARARTTTQGCGSDEADEVPNNVYGWGIIDALAGVDHAWLQVSKEGTVGDGFPAHTVMYSLTATSAAPFTLTDVTVTDTLPMSTSLRWADEGYELVGRTVSWSVPTLSSGAVLSKRLEVTLDNVAPGSFLVNDRYGARAGELSGSVGGVTSGVVIPCRILLFPVFSNWRPGEMFDG